uniref:NADH dehydrogenase subunit 2 n=1 Tax=Gnathostomula armata TaxID=231613 RepID=A0A0F6PZP5_9BILA|nr:NADH dehydrogenase subunit 2 [Gnathostomula armata]AKD00023.1 NADH dehydrogenase subunit 2 [Gnathostomula armata]
MLSIFITMIFLFFFISFNLDMISNWVVIEMLSFFIMKLYSKDFSIYFEYTFNQTISSLLFFIGIFLFFSEFFYSSMIFLTLFFMYKLAIFPFYLWYKNFLLKSSLFQIMYFISIIYFLKIYLMFIFLNFLLMKIIIFFSLMNTIVISIESLEENFNFLNFMVYSSLLMSIYWILSFFISLSMMVFFSSAYMFSLFFIFFVTFKENFLVKNIWIYAVILLGLPPLPLFCMKFMLLLSLWNFSLLFFILTLGFFFTINFYVNNIFLISLI